MKDLGTDVGVRVWSDSSAARAIAGRRGLGKLRHVELRLLWVQDVVKSGRIRLERIGGDRNPADHLTKVKSRTETKKILETVGAELVEAERKVGDGEGARGQGHQQG